MLISSLAKRICTLETFKPGMFESRAGRPTRMSTYPILLFADYGMSTLLGRYRVDPETLAAQERRQRHLAEACERLQRSGLVPNSTAPAWTRDDDMLVSDNLRYIYCPIGKVATRSWKYVLLRAAGSDVTMKQADNRHKIARVSVVFAE